MDKLMMALNKLVSDRIAVMTSIAGVVLMALTILTHVNPVEGSVVRPRWLLSVWAAPIHLTLLGASFPVQIASAYLEHSLFRLRWTSPGGLHLAVVYGTELVLQALLYFGIGKALSLGWRRWRRRCRPGST